MYHQNECSTVRQTPPCDAVGSPTRHAVPATTATAAGCPPPPQPPTAVTMMTPPPPAGRMLSPHVGTGNAVAAVCLGSSAAVGAAATVVARPAVAAGSYLAASVAGYCLRRGCLHKWPSEGGGGQLGAAEVRAPSLPPPPLSPESSHSSPLSGASCGLLSLSEREHMRITGVQAAPHLRGGLAPTRRLAAAGAAAAPAARGVLAALTLTLS